MNLVSNKQLLLNVPFPSTEFRRQELCVDNQIREIIGDVYSPTCRNEKCVYSSTNKTTSFYDDCKKCQASCNVLNFPFRDQKPAIMSFGCDGTHCFARKTSRDYEKEKPSPFLKKFLHQSQPSTSELEPKKFKMSPNLEKTYPFPISWWFERRFHFSNHFIRFESRVTRSKLINWPSTYRKSSLQRQNLVDSRFWSRLCYFCSKWSWPQFNNQPTRNIPSCLAFSVVSKPRFLG